MVAIHAASRRFVKCSISINDNIGFKYYLFFNCRKKRLELSKSIGVEEAVQVTTRARTITNVLTFWYRFSGLEWYILVVTVSAAASAPLHGHSEDTQLLIAVAAPSQVLDDVMILIETHIVVVICVVEIL